MVVSAFQGCGFRLVTPPGIRVFHLFSSSLPGLAKGPGSKIYPRSESRLPGPGSRVDLEIRTEAAGGRSVPTAQRSPTRALFLRCLALQFGAILRKRT